MFSRKEKVTTNRNAKKQGGIDIVVAIFLPSVNVKHDMMEFNVDYSKPSPENKNNGKQGKTTKKEETRQISGSDKCVRDSFTGVKRSHFDIFSFNRTNGDTRESSFFSLYPPADGEKQSLRLMPMESR